MDTSRINIKLGIELQQRCHSQGCNSVTFLGRDVQLNAPVFVKVINKANLLQDYFQEAQILYACKHPHIMEIRCAGEVDDQFVFVMDVCNEGSLQDLIENRFLTCKEIIRFSLDFLNGLHQVHINNFIHFDIKPSNIMLKNGIAILSDFGLTKHTNAHGFAIPAGMYNLHRPPEAFRAQELTSLADIYQTGVTLYRLCNGNIEYRKQLECCHHNLPESIINGTMPNRNIYFPHVPVSLQKILTKAMHVNPNKRYQTVLDLQNALASIDEYFSLDWHLEVTDNAYRWKRKTLTHEIIFQTIMSKNAFTSEGFKVNNFTGNARKISSCFATMSFDKWWGYCYQQLGSIK